MRHVLHGFTMSVLGLDFGIDTEEVTLPIPTPMTQDYRGGGMDLGVSMAMGAIEALETTVKMAGHNPDILGQMGRGPGQTSILTFRGAILSEASGGYVPHVVIIQGAINAGSRDTWQRGEKSGIEFMINNCLYFRYEAGSRVIHELQAYPPKRIVNGNDELSGINRAIGYSG